MDERVSKAAANMRIDGCACTFAPRFVTFSCTFFISDSASERACAQPIHPVAVNERNSVDERIQACPECFHAMTACRLAAEYGRRSLGYLRTLEDACGSRE